jgi:hypothetical protein
MTRLARPSDSGSLLLVVDASGTSSFGAGGDAGQNPPFGATVFFQLPANYDGKVPATLSFTDAAGHLVRRFDLHLKAKGQPGRTQLEEMQPAERRAAQQQKLTGVGPGMNTFQWDLRSQDATEVHGFEPPVPAGGLPDEVDGPAVTPESYRVILSYGGHEMPQPFDVALDPRIHAPESALQDRLALGLRIPTALDSLDRTINQAIDVRDHLGSGARARKTAAALDSTINSLVQLDLHSSEDSLLHETKLRSHLAYLAADIDLAYAAPTEAQAAVFEELRREARAGEQQVTAAMARAGAANRVP